MPVRVRCSFPSAVLAATAGTLLLAGCISDPGPRVAGSGQCRDAGLGWATGEVADEPTLRRLSRESGAGLVNPVIPTSAVRHDLRSDRLRVYLDADNRITAARCE